VTIDEMVMLTRAVTRVTRRAFVVADMPFGSYQTSDREAVVNAVRLVKEAGADAVKLEGTGTTLRRLRAIRAAGIAVMGHAGLTPQSVSLLGGYRARGRSAVEAQKIVRDAQALERAGCFAVVLEAIPAAIAARITETIAIPTIGIGAGSSCSGQVLVWHDLLGLTRGQLPRFVKQYASLAGTIDNALRAYVSDVRSGAFPEAVHTYQMPDAEFAAFKLQTPPAPAAGRRRKRTS
jgi:3-methyl-2-oxobutanoate hydroxymethyltransferase